MKQRIIVGMLLALTVFGILFFLPQLFGPLVLLVTMIAIWEWCRISQISAPNSYWLACITLGLWGASTAFPVVFTLLLVLTAVHYIYAFYCIARFETDSHYRLNQRHLIIIGPIILATLASTLLSIFSQPPSHNALDNTLALLFLITVIASADSGAYFVGRAIGKNKLSPRTSPNKTIEGLVGALVCVELVVIALGFMAERWQLSLWQLGLFSLIAAIFAAIGDLFISLIKRQNGIKDSSQILPGHGGILDRIDGMLAGIPVFYLLLQFV